jgi:hypothetical protein
MWPKKLSMHALSQQLPDLDILWTIPICLSRSLYATAV